MGLESLQCTRYAEGARGKERDKRRDTIYRPYKLFFCAVERRAVGTRNIECLGHGGVDAAGMIGRKLPLGRTIQVGAEAEDLQEKREAHR